jgi:hypothetical protein
MRRFRQLLAGAAAAALALAAPQARGQASPGDDANDAEKLFREGKALMAAKDYARACPKLAASQRMDPGTGTLLALALCHEAQGLTATAWLEFGRAIPLARRDGRNDRVELATSHVAQLDPKVSRVVVHVSRATRALAGIAVTRDGEALAPEEFDAPIPVDPGAHAIKATAAGHAEWEGRVTVAQDGKQYQVTVPDLPATSEPLSTSSSAEPSPAAKSPLPSALSDPGDHPAGQRQVPWIAYGLVGLGVAGVAAGGVFGTLAIVDSGKANGLCPGPVCRDPSAIDWNSKARTAATVSDVTFAAGLAALGTGVVIWLLAPKAPADAVQVGAGPNGTFVAVRGKF